jgi:alpha-beta hydrolase superfamily lysophospholipase
MPRVLLVAASLVVSACSAGHAGGLLIAHPVRLPVVGAPSEAHEDVQFQTEDGLTLRGWLFRPRGSPRGLVVLLHGKDANRQHLSHAAGRFVERGFAVLAYDQRGHGASDGSTITYGVREVPDLQRGLDAVGIAPVYVIGESLGAAVALRATARDPRIRGAVAAAAFSDLTTLIRERSPFADDTTRVALAEAERAGGFHAEDVSPARDAEHIEVPVLLLHGTEDTFIQPTHSYRIYEKLRGPKQLRLLEGVSHPGVLQDEKTWQVVETWLESQLQRPTAAHPQGPQSGPSRVRQTSR